MFIKKMFFLVIEQLKILYSPSLQNGELKAGLDRDRMFGLTACLETLNFKFAQYVMQTGVEGPKPPKKKEEELLTQLGVGEDEYFQGNKNRRRPNTEVDDSSMDGNMESHNKYNPEETKTVSLLTSFFLYKNFSTVISRCLLE